MDQTMSLNQNVETLFTNLENFTQKEGLLGKTVTQGDKTFIPIVSVALGYGNGSTATKSQSGNNSSQNSGSASGLGVNMGGGALGLGAKLSADAVILIDKGVVTMLPLNGTANAGQLVDKIPQILSGITQNNQQGQKPEQKPGN